MKKYILSLDNIDEVAKDVASQFQNGVIILRGDLASGKTTLVKAVVAHLGINEDVTSPTFSLQHAYANRVFHYDIYNHGLEHFMALGMLEELEREGLHLIEWGDDALVALLRDAGINVISVDIKKISDKEREYSVCIY
ncbi:MAG: tRNA (adenosine(37)-N6)-threonylcarbamoyltransferase complex ATPase subunit type 1 TsaE [Sulfurimonas sp.]|uniref:tRNA (adenosine(37)-N6)-threonylcarbamoyltransferase complex ATPase subunit type 1 TsaE n=1 Tax=Sulfurimonas sp. TaxID=2022749 RepID=UPI00261BDED3|nr:tRNA (adenosine(37)-N6)-threonylcarbamoyltransferase complex ATPase subunit type 1 TsaE [Sulfurimonas sp.]MDD2652239.1 tRNA (adenosine(37)-N6)-threonylcarbamoyltransferase complex ATPase subunit type 1 TsaE [Sulfurimonas sp.]MDD3451592.1 tRNA (adenosine(37)-N6)-threonylcarbamoyltransferase complex ATPase subunit type 1 TsaE [Sulfurimonas sp.]